MSNLRIAYINYWTNFAKFRARSTRADFWWALLPVLAIGVILWLLAFFLHGTFLWILFGLYELVNVVPTLSLFVRRVRDIGLTGWVILIYPVLLEINLMMGIFGIVMNVIITVVWILILCGDTDVMPDGWWTPDFENPMEGHAASLSEGSDKDNGKEE